MDGASKFVRGDAIAGLIITAINIFGGIIIGVTHHGLTLSRAADVYTKLSVGDGLVSQMPALIVSLSAGLLVSKGGTRGSAEQAVLRQLGGYPRAVSAAALMMFVLALMPGLPMTSDVVGLTKVAPVSRRGFMPRACGANTAPIAFAEVYLALQNGTVEAQENPLTTIEAKKFYEVQKHIVLTGHIVDHLNTVVAGALWKKLSDEDKKIFTDVAQEAAAKATAEIKQNEAKLVAFFKEKGLTVTEVDKNEFRDIVLKNVPFETFGYRKADWERIQEVK